MGSDKKVTVHDVARIAGVSIKTVSRVMNNDPNVRESNKINVLAAIEETGYRPDVNARRLRTRQSYIICMLYVDYASNSYSSRLTSGAIDACDQAGYDLLVRPIKEPSVAYSLIDDLVKRSNPDGYILTPPLCDDKKLIKAIESHGKKVVKILPLELDEASCVHCDIVGGVKSAISHLISLGHRRIALLNFNTVHGGLLRYQGFKEAHEKHGIDIDDTLIFQTPLSDEEYETVIRTLLSSPSRPTAFFTFNDYMATIVYRVASQLKIRVPYDLSVIGFDDDPISKQMWPPLSTIHQPVVNLGQAAAEKLIYRQIQSTSHKSDLNLQCHYVKRSSCGPLL